MDETGARASSDQARSRVTDVIGLLMVLGLLVGAFGAVAWVTWHGDASRWDDATVVDVTRVDDVPCKVGQRWGQTRTCPATWTDEAGEVEGEVTDRYGGEVPAPGDTAPARVLRDDLAAVGSGNAKIGLGSAAPFLTVGAALVVVLLEPVRRRAERRAQRRPSPGA